MRYKVNEHIFKTVTVLKHWKKLKSWRGMHFLVLGFWSGYANFDEISQPIEPKPRVLGWNQRYFKVDYEFIKWPSCKSMYNQKLANQRPKTTFCSRNPCKKCNNLIEIWWETYKTFQLPNLYQNIFNLRPFPAVWHNLLINGSERESNPQWFS